VQNGWAPWIGVPVGMIIPPPQPIIRSDPSK
jgi:hypothetical protein